MKSILKHFVVISAIVAMVVLVDKTPIGTAARLSTSVFQQPALVLPARQVEKRILILQLGRLFPPATSGLHDYASIALYLDSLPLFNNLACFIDLPGEAEINTPLSTSMAMLRRAATRHGCILGMDRRLVSQPHTPDQPRLAAMHLIRQPSQPEAPPAALAEIRSNQGDVIPGIAKAMLEAAGSPMPTPAWLLRPFVSCLARQQIADAGLTIDSLPVPPGALVQMDQVTHSPLTLDVSAIPSAEGKFVFVGFSGDSVISSGPASPPVPALNAVAAAVFTAAFRPMYNLTSLGELTIDYLLAFLILAATILAAFFFPQATHHALHRFALRVSASLGVMAFVVFVPLSSVIAISWSKALLVALFTTAHPWLDSLIESAAVRLLAHAKDFFTPALLLLVSAAAALPANHPRLADLVYLKGEVEVHRAATARPATFRNDGAMKQLLHLHRGDRIRCKGNCEALIQFLGASNPTALGSSWTSIEPLTDLDRLRASLDQILIRAGAPRSSLFVLFPHEDTVFEPSDVLLVWNPKLASGLRRLSVYDHAGRVVLSVPVPEDADRMHLDLSAVARDVADFQVAFQGDDDLHVSWNIHTRKTTLAPSSPLELLRQRRDLGLLESIRLAVAQNTVQPSQLSAEQRKALEDALALSAPAKYFGSAATR